MSEVVSSVRVKASPAHDIVRVWNRGGFAGELVVTKGDGEEIAARLAAAGLDRIGELRRVLEPQPEPDADELGAAVAKAREVVDELLEWRSAAAAAFGVVTATPRETLLSIARYRDKLEAVVFAARALVARLGSQDTRPLEWARVSRALLETLDALDVQEPKEPTDG